MDSRRRPEDSLSFDIFCRVIDNFGDIGVCWRLALQLAHVPMHHQVRLWVDDLACFQHLAPSIDIRRDHQQLNGVHIKHWTDSSTPVPDLPTTDDRTSSVGDVVIEAFGCDLPHPWRDAIKEYNRLWLNLEYLSAESWVDDFHLQPSIQPGGLRKYFFFPGFTRRTGGLLREAGLIQRRNAWQVELTQRNALLQHYGFSAADIQAIERGARLIFVFCYPDAPLPVLAATLAENNIPAFLLLPEGVYPDCEHRVSACTGVQVRRVPFVAQEQFDCLLWSCDLNIVRGEDSLVRALWAARPMIWQPYPQAENTHLTKLDAWLARSPLNTSTRALIRSWTTADAGILRQELSQHLNPVNWKRWQLESARWSEELASQPDLATALVQFCRAEICSARRTR